MNVDCPHNALIAPLREAMYNFSNADIRSKLRDLCADDVRIHMCHPLGDMMSADQLYDCAYAPLSDAFPGLERRDYIVVAGSDDNDENWVGCAGFYVGRFENPWLDIPPTHHIAHMRFHEFYKIEDKKVIEIQAIWDIPEMMMQADVWPMAQALGREMLPPGPATQDGIMNKSSDSALSAQSLDIVIDMLNHMNKHPGEGGPEIMEMERFWHPLMNWYGPAGIGTARGIDGFRKRHQIPFLKAMPDRGQYPDEVNHHFFAHGHYVAVTGWPNMSQTLTGDGWLGLAPTGQRLTLRSLDFWRLENGLIRENWVLVDLLDVFHQLGIDVFERMRNLVNVKNNQLMLRA